MRAHEGATAAAARAVSADPLGFPGYREQLARARDRTGRDESVEVETSQLGGCDVVVARFEFGFMGGSMGEATGRRLVAAAEAALAGRRPLVTIARSGGARVQEGMRSLIQMQRVAAALERLRVAGIPHIAVATDPTTGGVWASLVSAADVIVAVDGAEIAFAGRRVRGGDAEDAAAAPFTASGKLADGAVDAAVAPEDLHDVLGAYVRMAALALQTPPVSCPPPAALPGADVPGSGWGAVSNARGPVRPRADAYLDAYFDETVAIRGDRCTGDDPGMRCGFGRRAGRVVAFAAQLGTGNGPAGFRTATRLFALAERWQVPVLTLIDTPGAQHDDAAERGGIGTAIAETFAALARLTVPVTSLLVGEGGSGGALAIASPNALWAVPSSYFSIISPEGAASILLRDPRRAAEIAERLALAPRDLLRLGVIRGVVATEAAAAPRSG